MHAKITRFPPGDLVARQVDHGVIVTVVRSRHVDTPSMFKWKHRFQLPMERVRGNGGSERTQRSELGFFFVCSMTI